MGEEQKQIEQRWGLAEQSAGFGVWDLNVPLQQVQYSAQWKAVLGYDAVDTPDSTATWRARVHPDDLPSMLAIQLDHLQGRTAAYQTEFRLRCADGSYRWVLSRGRVVERDAAGQAVRAVGTLIDLTDRHQEEVRRRDQDRAAAVQTAQSEFLSRMSHELRTPLNAVLGFAQLLALRIGQHNVEEQRRYVGHIETAGWQLLRMVDDVLDLANLEAGKLQVQLVPVELTALMAAGMAHVEADALRQQVDLRAPDLTGPVMVVADARRLGQVLGQLLNNAIRYNRPGGLVRLALRDEGAHWVMVVADTGIGIPAAQLEHLFEPFNRLGRRSTGAEGVGVGLVLARSLLALMAGQLRVSSTEGQGSSFEIRLPRHVGP
jgi:PAS domain S-box-containing protein